MEYDSRMADLIVEMRQLFLHQLLNYQFSLFNEKMALSAFLQDNAAGWQPEQISEIANKWVSLIQNWKILSGLQENDIKQPTISSRGKPLPSASYQMGAALLEETLPTMSAIASLIIEESGITSLDVYNKYPCLFTAYCLHFKDKKEG